MSIIKAPACTHCGQPPYAILANGRQAFCGNDDCPVFTWDMTVTREENLASQTEIDLTFLEREP